MLTVTCTSKYFSAEVILSYDSMGKMEEPREVREIFIRCGMTEKCLLASPKRLAKVLLMEALHRAIGKPPPVISFDFQKRNLSGAAHIYFGDRQANSRGQLHAKTFVLNEPRKVRTGRFENMRARRTVQRQCFANNKRHARSFTQRKPISFNDIRFFFSG